MRPLVFVETEQMMIDPQEWWVKGGREGEREGEREGGREGKYLNRRGYIVSPRSLPNSFSRRRKAREWRPRA